MTELTNLTKESIDKKFLIRVAETVLKNEQKKNFELSVVLVGKERIKRLNKEFLKKDRPTDVLAFPENEELLKRIKPKEKNYPLGEIVICPEQIRKNAQDFKMIFEKELARVLIHGILHLLGYDHEKTVSQAKKMKEKENYYFQKI